MQLRSKHTVLLIVALLGACASPDKPVDTTKEVQVIDDTPDKMVLIESMFSLNDSNSIKPEGVELMSINQIKEFYKLNKYLAAWTSSTGFSTMGYELMQGLTNVGSYGLLSENYPLEEIDHLMKKIESVETTSIIEPLRADLELIMSEAYFRLATHLNRGMLDRDSLNYTLKIDSMPYNMGPYLYEAIAEEKVVKSLIALQPNFRAYKKLQKHAALFLAANKDLTDKFSEQLAEDAEDEEKLQYAINYLMLESYIDSVEAMDDSLVTYALMIFQRRHGLIEDGQVGKNTLKAMQMSKEAKYNAILVNLERLRWTNTLPDAYFYVNKAAYNLKVIEQDSIIRSHRVVVGSKTNITPEIESKIEYFVTNPIWYVPRSISTKEILPKMQKDSTYIKRNNYAVYTKSGQSVSTSDIDWSSLSVNDFGYKIRQKPGGGNSLGKLKFIFPNKHSVYLHDTPSKSFFSRDLRTFSHGCVRLEEPAEIARYLLEFDEHEITPDSLDTLLDDKITKKIYLNKPHPIFIKYYTCEVNEYNELVFYKDVYGRDEQICNALYRRPVDLKYQLASRGI